MKLDYSITVKTEDKSVQIDGLNINLSANYKKGNLPDIISINVSGNINAAPQNPGTLLLVNGTFNVAQNSFSIINSSGITEAFLSELQTKILEFYNTIKIGEGDNV